MGRRRYSEQDCYSSSTSEEEDSRQTRTRATSEAHLRRHTANERAQAKEMATAGSISTHQSRDEPISSSCRGLQTCGKVICSEEVAVHDELGTSRSSVDEDDIDICVHDDEEYAAAKLARDDAEETAGDDDANNVVIRLERLRYALKEDLTSRLIAQAAAKVVNPFDTKFQKEDLACMHDLHYGLSSSKDSSR